MVMRCVPSDGVMSGRGRLCSWWEASLGNLTLANRVCQSEGRVPGGPWSQAPVSPPRRRWGVLSSEAVCCACLRLQPFQQSEQPRSQSGCPLRGAAPQTPGSPLMRGLC